MANYCCIAFGKWSRQVESASDVVKVWPCANACGPKFLSLKLARVFRVFHCFMSEGGEMNAECFWFFPFRRNLFHGIRVSESTEVHSPDHQRTVNFSSLVRLSSFVPLSSYVMACCKIFCVSECQKKKSTVDSSQLAWPFRERRMNTPSSLLTAY